MNAVKSLPSPVERRAFGRRETDIKAAVRAGQRLHVCTIRDLSEGGALLEFEQDVELPQRLWLRWDDLGTEIICEVRRQGGRRAGVQFARPIALTPRATVAPSQRLGERAPLVPAPLPNREHVHETLDRAADIVAKHRKTLRREGGATAVVPPRIPDADRGATRSDLTEPLASESRLAAIIAALKKKSPAGAALNPLAHQPPREPQVALQGLIEQAIETHRNQVPCFEVQPLPPRLPDDATVSERLAESSAMPPPLPQPECEVAAADDTSNADLDPLRQLVSEVLTDKLFALLEWDGDVSPFDAAAAIVDPSSRALETEAEGTVAEDFSDPPPVTAPPAPLAAYVYRQSCDVGLFFPAVPWPLPALLGWEGFSETLALPAGAVETAPPAIDRPSPPMPLAASACAPLNAPQPLPAAAYAPA